MRRTRLLAGMLCLMHGAPAAGTIPRELSGTLLRNGPGLFEVGGQPISQPLDGDGMVRSCHLLLPGRLPPHDRLRSASICCSSPSLFQPCYASRLSAHAWT